MSPVEQIAKANQAAIEQGKPDGDPVSVPDDASWLPPTRGRTAEVEDVPEEQNEQDLEDQIQTKWSQVHTYVKGFKHHPLFPLSRNHAISICRNSGV